MLRPQAYAVNRGFLKPFIKALKDARPQMVYIAVLSELHYREDGQWFDLSEPVDGFQDEDVQKQILEERKAVQEKYMALITSTDTCTCKFSQVA